MMRSSLLLLAGFALALMAGVLEEFGKVRKVRPDFSDAKLGSIVTNWYQAEP